MTPSLFLYLEPNLESQISDLRMAVVVLCVVLMCLVWRIGRELDGKADKPKDSKEPK